MAMGHLKEVNDTATVSFQKIHIFRCFSTTSVSNYMHKL